MNEDMMTEAERASKLAEPATEDTATRGKGVFYVHTSIMTWTSSS